MQRTRVRKEKSLLAATEQGFEIEEEVNLVLPVAPCLTVYSPM